ncbi:ribonuclease P protein component [Patescibacteria group bacterium]|nr:ribonuclease P protein component [Patescibacteria group bacterium]
MLTKENRLKYMKDFEILFKEGKFVGGQFLTVKIWKIEPDKYPRREYSTEDLKIGFVVGKKVHKSAVKRNRIKRQMREVVRLLLKENKLKIGYHIAFLAKPEIFGVEYGEIEKDIVGVLKRLGVFK